MKNYAALAVELRVQRDTLSLILLQIVKHPNFAGCIDPVGAGGVDLRDKAKAALYDIMVRKLEAPEVDVDLEELAEKIMDKLRDCIVPPSSTINKHYFGPGSEEGVIAIITEFFDEVQL